MVVGIRMVNLKLKKVGDDKLWNGDDDGDIMIKESDWNWVMGKMMDSYKKGEMGGLLDDV